MNGTNRRNFLKTVGVGAGALTLSMGMWPRRALAAVDRNFIFCYFEGGWDTLLSLDPRDPDVFTDARRGETLIELGWDRLAQPVNGLITPSGSNITFGPAMGGCADHFDKMCVVRGMTMNTVAHEIGRRYFLTGLMPTGGRAKGPSVPARIVGQQGDERAIPNLACRVESYAEGEPAYAAALSVNTVLDLQLSLTNLPARLMTPQIRSRLAEYRGGQLDCDASGLNKRGFLDRLRSSQNKALDLVNGNLNELFMFTNTGDPEMVAISERYGIGQNMGSGAAQAAMAYQALKNDIAQCVSIQMTRGLDTHDTNWATDQLPIQTAGWNALGTLIADLKNTPDPRRGGNLIDNTTILCFSEFGRTALLNSRNGRDHSLTSSALLVGAGVAHNRVVGASSDVGMNPMAIDELSGAPTVGGTFITPTKVIASVLEASGLETGSLRETGISSLKG